MFREQKQTKNIMSLGIVSAIIGCYIVLLLGGFSIERSIQRFDATSALEQTINSTVYSSDITTSIYVESAVVDSSELESASTPTSVPSSTYSTVDSDTSTCTSSQPMTADAGKSEVIEYPVDAQTTGVYTVPNINTSFKSYTYYTLLNKSSPQSQLQKIAYTDENGLRKVKQYYCVAMGSYYSTTLGDLFRITTDTGNVFEVIICDAKDDAHTDPTHRYTRSNHCMVEFYVDRYALNPSAKTRGSISAITGFDGSIQKVEYLGYYDWK